ncbi:MAG: HDIG domain-containing protein [Anaerolineae bacterium]|nr:MAG: HDIG domain-containing protein [Anaerolineae bacterium]
MTQAPRRAPLRLRIIQGGLLTLTTVISFAALVLPLALRPAALPLKAGDVAPRDLLAPRDIEYVSDVLTEEARQAAEHAVAPVYAPADPAIAREQIARLRATLQYISIVRADAYATPEQKLADLAALRDISLPRETAERILTLSASRWDAIQQEALSVLERVMRNPIRPDEVESIRRDIPSLVSLALSEENAQLVAELVRAFVAPNSLYSPELTEAARQAAREAIEPVVQSYKAGEIVVRSGEVITEADLEALQRLGLIQSEPQISDYLGAAALVIVLATFVGLYFNRRPQPFLDDPRSLTLISLAFIVFLVAARLVIPNRTVIPYVYPVPAFGLLLTALFTVETGLVFSLPLCLLAAYGLPNMLDLMPFYLLATLSGVLVLGQARRVWAFVRAGMAIAGAGAAMMLAYRLPFTPTDWVGSATLFGAAAFNGMASASLTLLLQYFLAQLLGFATALQLLEISRPDFPLLQFFLRHAPGTYQHSLQVANLAEQAAERIGADALLTRVGALYHDVGKAANPAFFIENQTPGSINPHHDLPPSSSATTIIQHVLDGLHLARKYRLPRRVQDFILEHHGTLVARYQYAQALEAAGGDPSKVDVSQYRYPGPRPRSRETAILMLADGVEALVRAEHPETEDELRALVRRVIDERVKQGQLNDSNLTLSDLHQIQEAFVSVLRGTQHPRLQYPSAEGEIAEDIPTRPVRQVR